jgi:hypothetical protein
LLVAQPEKVVTSSNSVSTDMINLFILLHFIHNLAAIKFMIHSTIVLLSIALKLYTEMAGKSSV